MASVAGARAELYTWLGADVVADDDKAEAILAAAYTLVRSKTGRSWVDADGNALEDVDADDFEAVKTVIVQVALRVWLNPKGVTQETKGPFSRSMADWATLGLSLTEAEIDMLPSSTSNSRPALWTLATTRCENDLPDIYLEVVGSEDIPHVPQGSVNW